MQATCSVTPLALITSPRLFFLKMVWRGKLKPTSAFAFESARNHDKRGPRLRTRGCTPSSPSRESNYQSCARVWVDWFSPIAVVLACSRLRGTSGSPSRRAAPLLGEAGRAFLRSLAGSAQELQKLRQQLALSERNQQETKASPGRETRRRRARIRGVASRRGGRARPQDARRRPRRLPDTPFPLSRASRVAPGELSTRRSAMESSAASQATVVALRSEFMHLVEVQASAPRGSGGRAVLFARVLLVCSALVALSTRVGFGSFKRFGEV